MFDIYTSVNSHKHDGIQEQVYSIRIQNGKNSQNVVLLNEHPKRNQRNAREYALVFKYLYQHQYNGKDIVIKCPGNSSRTLANIRIYGQKNWPLSKRTSYEQYIHFKLTGQRDHGIPKDSVDNGQLKLMKIAYHYLTKLGINDITVSPCDRQDPEFQQLRQFNRDYMRHNGSTKQSGSRSLILTFLKAYEKNSIWLA